MTRLYVLPIVGAGVKGDPRRPKYTEIFGGFDWTIMDFGVEPACILCVDGIDQTTHDLLAANADVAAVPENLDQQIGGAITAVRNVLEALNIPALWAQGTDTYRVVVRTVAAMFQFFQVLQGMGVARIFGGSITLSTRFNQLPQGTRSVLLDAAAQMGFDSSSLSGASTMRQILKAMADQWGNRPISIGILI